MIRLSFSEEEVKELDWQRYHHPHPRVQKKTTCEIGSILHA